jgi:hypothetical protein
MTDSVNGMARAYRTGVRSAQRGKDVLVHASNRLLVQGHVSRGFESVREAFSENFARRRELGGACCAYRHGEKVVDLWGGIRNKRTGEP